MFSLLLVTFFSCTKNVTLPSSPTVILSISPVSLPTNTLSNGNLCLNVIKVKADSTQMIGWRQICFTVDTVNCRASNYCLMNLAHDSTGSDTIAKGIVSGPYIVFRLQVDHYLRPGQSERYALMANVVCGAGSASFSSYITENNAAGPAFCSALPRLSALIWCKITAHHNPDGADYYSSSSLVKGLPTIAQTLSK